MGEFATLTLLKDKCYAGESSFGQYFLYNVRNEAGVELSFFAPADIHASILEAGLKTGDSFLLSKKAVQNGKKVGAKLEFEAVKKPDSVQPEQPGKKEDVRVESPDDGFRQLMYRCVSEAVQIVKDINTVPWQNEDIRSIALTMFIQRAKLG